MEKPSWQASSKIIAQTQMTSYARYVSANFGLGLSNLQDNSYWPGLYKWSVENLDFFWQSIADFCQVHWLAPYSCVRSFEKHTPMRHHKWFPDGHLNYAQNLLLATSEKPDLIIDIQEGMPPRELSRTKLVSDTLAIANWLRSQDLHAGDVIAAVVSNSYECIVFSLASAAHGLIWTSCSPDFGEQAIFDRFEQVSPKILIGTSQYQYGGKIFDCREKLLQIAHKLPSLKSLVLLPFQSSIQAVTPRQPGFTIVNSADLFLSEELPSGSLDEVLRNYPFAKLPFDHPLYIVYSSGTTGVPKCIVHGHGGTLLQHLKEQRLHCDLRPKDRLFYYTTCGWMMWNWMLSGLATGSSLLLYDGAVQYPSPTALWDFVERHQVTVFGTSPRFLSSSEQAGLKPKDSHNLEKLRMILSTGSPLLQEHYQYVYQQAKEDVHLTSISGGTDILSCFMLGNPILPVYAGEIQSPGLGMAVEAWDEGGRPLIEAKGELVCTQPFPSMPIGFWGLEGDEKYRQAYFDFYKDREVWRHGDFVEITSRGGVIVYGRSDATLNPGGVRIGTAELYRVVEKTSGVVDSIAVGLQRNGDTQILLFVKLRAKETLSDNLKTLIKQEIRRQLSPRHVPWSIEQIADIPYTRSGKKMELAVENAVNGRAVPNLSAAGNPESIEGFFEWYRSSRDSNSIS
jgi:acetoacetyl-CoA synthetase